MRALIRALVAVAALPIVFGATAVSLPLSMAVVTGSDGRAHVVPAAHVDPELELLVNVPQRMLYRLEGGHVREALPIAVGRASWPTPIGPFRIVTREEQPTWDVPVSIQEEMRRAGKPVVTKVPPGPTNPLGAYWLGTSLPGIGIHGTVQPSSISKFATHGCIRLRPADIALLFPLVRIDAPGLVVYEPVLMARTRGGIFVDASPDAYRRMPGSALAALQSTADGAGIGDRIDWALVARALQARDGAAHRVNRE